MDVLEDKMVTTRKPHDCWGCAKKFPTGTRMWFTKTADGGGISMAWLCEECIDILDSLEAWEKEDGFDYGELLNYKQGEKG